MNLITPFDMFVSNFCTNWKSLKEDGKDYTFEDICGIFITDQHKILEQGKIVHKHQAHFLKGKRNMDLKDESMI
jgi:hypothetical protein